MTFCPLTRFLYEKRGAHTTFSVFVRSFVRLVTFDSPTCILSTSFAPYFSLARSLKVSNLSFSLSECATQKTIQAQRNLGASTNRGGLRANEREREDNYCLDACIIELRQCKHLQRCFSPKTLHLGAMTTTI